MKKIFSLLLATVFLLPGIFTRTAAATTHTVVSGDSLWKIANQYRVGLSELKSANPQIRNYDLIYPGQSITVPTLDPSVAGFEQEVIRLINEIRADNGLNTLSHHWQLSRVARFKSQDMRENRYFAHNSPVYGTPFQMIRSFGISFRSAGENIAKGYHTPRSVVNAWMDSPGHRSNILNSAYTHIGVGYDPAGHYWTQMFITK